MRWLVSILFLLAIAGVAWGEDEPKPEVLKKMYADTLEQLKAAQDRKSQLAARVEELEKQLAAANAQIEQFKLESSQYAEKSFFLRAYYAAWTQFIAGDPLLKIRWDFYLENQSPVAPSLQFQLLDPEWPLSAKG
jgi:TolA-binding protein